MSEASCAAAWQRGEIPVEQAQALLLAALAAAPVPVEVPLGEALGRVAAGEIRAAVEQPPFTRSPLDGYALRAAEIAGARRDAPRVLPVSQYICAGDSPSGPLAPGTAARVMTGAPLPAGADCVVRQEDTAAEEGRVVFYACVPAGANVCRAGEDLAAGALLLSPGTRLEEAHVGLLAAQGMEKVGVWTAPRVAVMPTGDELTPPGRPLPPGGIYDANGPMLAARLRRLGAEPAAMAAGADDPKALGLRLGELLERYPLVITTGGVSVGDKDYLPRAAQAAGARPLFHGIDAKPGSPALGAEKGGHVLLALSGNPFASFATFELLARPAVAKLLGMDTALPRVRTRLENGFKKPSPMRRFVRGRLWGGSLRLPERGHSSGGIGALVGCNCLVDIPAGSGPLLPGDEVEAVLL